ncbi:MAG: ADP-ribosylglycohydrolase family protein [Ruminococcus sp.]|nr:ADP-ribosylglycohydrolase family protein [Ruminococcus sp.]
MNTVQDKIRGSLIGGAAGDALGYAVEFQNESEIFKRYSGGIRQYALDRRGLAVISDDTQMTLFTACGILNALNHQTNMEDEVLKAYFEWLDTQEIPFAKRGKKAGVTPLWDVPELFVPRAPGITCLSALRSTRRFGKCSNNSKGCGGVMRVAPAGMLRGDISELDALGGACAYMTHQHPLGYMPAAVLAHIVNRIVFPERKLTLREIVLDSCDTLAEIYPGQPGVAELTALLQRAIDLSENSRPDLENIHALGEGWVGDEALAIAVYCCLRHEDDFSAALIAAVNHKGDSDSTGAITGNILGAWFGCDAMDTQWKQRLELSDLILSIADALAAAAEKA